jgi:hypothetical protein
MKTILICGSRSVWIYDVLELAIKNSQWNIGAVVSGGAPGVDRMAERWARANNADLVVFHANWGRHKKSAGPIRNRKMVEYLMTLDDIGIIALWDGKSRGTAHTIKLAKKFNLPLYVELVS